MRGPGAQTWKVFWKQKTNKGRVVWNRKIHGFTLKDVRRIFTSVALNFEVPEDVDEYRKSFEEWTITMLQIMVAAYHPFRRLQLDEEWSIERSHYFYPTMRQSLMEFIHIMELFPMHKFQELWDWILETVVESVGSKTEIGTTRPEAVPGGARIPMIERRK